MYILLIEDDVLWRGQLQIMIEEHISGATIGVARTVEEARAMLEMRMPDVVVSDIVLKNQRSFEIFTPLARDYPIIFITSYPQHDYLKQALSLPNTSFLVKPFHGLSLLAAIDTLLGNMKLSTIKTGGFIEIFGKFKQKQPVYFNEILYLEADGNYASIHKKNQKVHTIKLPLRDLLLKADERFLRVHKSFAINVDFAKRLDLSRNLVRLEETTIPVGRAYRKKAIEVLSKISD